MLTMPYGSAGFKDHFQALPIALFDRLDGKQVKHFR